MFYVQICSPLSFGVQRNKSFLTVTPWDGGWFRLKMGVQVGKSSMITLTLKTNGKSLKL